MIDLVATNSDSKNNANSFSSTKLTTILGYIQIMKANICLHQGIVPSLLVICTYSKYFPEQSFQLSDYGMGGEK